MSLPGPLGSVLASLDTGTVGGGLADSIVSSKDVQGALLQTRASIGSKTVGRPCQALGSIVNPL